MAGLNRDLFRLNNILRMNRGQESSFAAESQHVKIPASALPQWLKPASRCCYVSKTTGAMHNVKVQKIDERSQTVTVVFEADAKNGKKVPFAECSKMGDGTLRPVWKANQQVAGPAPAPAGTKAEARAEAPARPAKAATSEVEDIVSSGDEGKEPELPPLPPLPPSPEAEKPRQLHFLPRAVALGGKKAPATIGPAPRPDSAPPSPTEDGAEAPDAAVAAGPAPAPAPAGPAEISDDEEADKAAAVCLGRSRSPRQRPAGKAG
mmetsp:Transcript_61714/g.191124  ORF Transcript_61714/g.191124 Transcript_61714/m.191124 type:complete len:263 (-) Transcript_61714:10-798(-)|eukprot:CAMPEP_0175561984 /NCGR_PEP_ID=MMETSP0096-20121207/37689_1 /TAXON_ID=311494 /ORGANISM="Alexandrium monilatum, Strain CCMP3105" /LENGTH=262 /DNA_ID=CAMNT_0016865215 /DNA_START=25 /DNA_END=810 /DNA_ORIENTATION=+